MVTAGLWRVKELRVKELSVDNLEGSHRGLSARTRAVVAWRHHSITKAMTGGILALKISRAPLENRNHANDMSPLRSALLYTTRLQYILHALPDLYRHVSEGFQGPNRESNSRQYVEIFSSIPPWKQDFYVLWNIGIMRKWRDNFRTVVQETKFDWRFLIESRTHQTPTDNSQRIRLVRGWAEGRERESLRENRFGAPGRKTERDHRRLGLQFFLHYVLFFLAIPALPRDPLVKMNPSSARLQTWSSLYLHLITATTVFFFQWRFKEIILTRVTARILSQPVKIRVTNNGSCFVRANENNVAWRTLAT